MKNINIILPYKETYNTKIAGAVSILVSQLSKFSSFKKTPKSIELKNKIKQMSKFSSNYIQIINGS